ncbi:LOW QUALITY PROTEIN: UDP-glucose:glycoprotein glucosyltransferase 1-like [Uloborus diversus]|uniref:LOW QUALITY PROTEIN: UDP-glucose:glycoprotein glucosyltransferase 1-like n=1 Tax=Uloborus diversus TaxID=327109 RepID=UPI00240A1B4C|nr:LOW QUALITY PROTEIN: UDP-glucose:glycoprotein glucosyltransferase 1-like [Uloborus diversus]
MNFSQRCLLIHAALCILRFVQAQTLQKSVSVVLDAKWLDTPLHLEASEFLAEESPELFWKFINDCSKLQNNIFHKNVAKASYESVLNISSNYLSPTKVALLKFSLALRTYSPAVELFHQIAYDQNFPANCEVIAIVGEEIACDIPTLKSLLSESSRNATSVVYQVDHIFPNAAQSADVILYGEIGTSSFNKLYNFLMSKAEKSELSFAVRHFVAKRKKRKVRLSGYGVELAVKSTEYKAQDDTKVKEEKGNLVQEEIDKFEEHEGFIFSKLKELHPSKKDELEQLKSHILDSAKEIPSLKVWELQELSLQAAQRILDSPVEEALRIMKEIAQNFPTQARSLIHVSVSSDMRKEMDSNQQMFLHHHNLGPSDAAVFLNGMFFDMDTTDIFSLLQVIKQETRILESLHKSKINEEMLTKLLKMDFALDKEEYAVDIRDSSIQYINDIETDRQYRTWPSSVQDLLRPAYPGMLRNIKKNMYHLVIAADPSKSNAKDIFKLAESFYVHKAPVRIGLLFAVNPDFSVDGFHDTGVAFLNAFNFISQDKTPYDGLAFITEVYANNEDSEISIDSVTSHFKSMYPNEDMDLIFGLDSDYDTGRKAAWEFINKTGLGKPPQVLLNGVMLKQMQLTADMFEEAILSEIMRQTPPLQKSIYKGELTDSHNILDFLMDQKNVMPRLNQRILSSDSTYIDLINGNADMMLKKMKYFVKRDEDDFRSLTVWIVCDVNTAEGRALLLSALSHLKTSLHTRIGVIHNPSASIASRNIISKSIEVALEVLDRHTAKLFVTKLLKPANAKQVMNGEKSVTDFSISTMENEIFLKHLEAFDEENMSFHEKFCKNTLKLSSGDRAIVINGRVIGPLEDGEEFTQEDFHLLEIYSTGLYADKIVSEFKTHSKDGKLDSDMLMKISSVLLAHSQPKVRHEIKFFSDKFSAIKIPAAQLEEPAHEVVVIVDPVSKGAAKLSSMLMVLQRVINAHFKIFLNCVDKHSAMPLRSFYRFVLNEEPVFGTNGEFGVAPLAKFSGLPSSPLFTLGMITPENWLVEVVKSPYDLDNIHLEQVESSVHADFELEHLLIEGHCFEQSSGNPPRGLQFILGTKSSPAVVDTIVMANLGYFQLKANPGAWHLNLRQGRSTDIYDIVGSDNTDMTAGSSDLLILISSFRSHIIKVKVAKKPGKQFEELLYDDADTDNGIWSTITSMPIIGGIVEEWRTIWLEIKSTLSGNKGEMDAVDDKINIFSLASGHLYERLLRIMMLSVLKNTKTPVKFWFLKNFLSPTFKDFLPHMAKHYGFEYELVQYKWPRWLNQQSEKQRVIWGYKILFLDVLFPLDVKKFIFVDADQVVRADMKELNDLDLGGAPYGYTPFCDSRKDMDGYRFWKSGYWASHLAGRKYHISALYVVDLKRFRRVAAGDRIRGQYQGLSQDPNSLSNLDQDLPNNMIHQVAIKSLPQEWLWCETWCSDDTKKYAKTIDLCNNPKTKESKLQSAMRIIPEWKDYDSEIKNLFQEFEKQKTSVQTDDSVKTTDDHDEL